jgi:hypothetical protein
MERAGVKYAIPYRPTALPASMRTVDLKRRARRQRVAATLAAIVSALASAWAGGWLGDR